MRKFKREIVVELTKSFAADRIEPWWFVSNPKLEGDWSGVSSQEIDVEIGACLKAAKKHVDKLNDRGGRSLDGTPLSKGI